MDYWHGLGSIMAQPPARLAGSALFVGVVQFGISLLLAEATYPGYSVSTNAISDLGATCKGEVCQIFQPSSTIFNSSIVILGLLVLLTSYYLQKAFKMRLLTIFVAIAALSMMGVGIFPETTGIIHSIVSFLTFFFIGLVAIVAYRVERAPLSYLSVILGVITLIAMTLYGSGTYLGLGAGGMERMIVFPVLLWSLGFGGSLIARE